MDLSPSAAQGRQSPCTVTIRGIRPVLLKHLGAFLDTDRLRLILAGQLDADRQVAGALRQRSDAVGQGLVGPVFRDGSNRTVWPARVRFPGPLVPSSTGIIPVGSVTTTATC